MAMGVSDTGAQGMHCIEVPITGLQGQQLSMRCVLLLLAALGYSSQLLGP